MRVLVTGATGVYGRGVVERLVRAGHDVVAMARNAPKALPAGVQFSAGDVSEYADVERAMTGCEVVAHLAFVVSPLKSEAETRRINLGGTQNVVDAMRATGARRLVFVSSAMSYGANADNPPLFTEQHEQRPSPDYIYGTCKMEAEAIIRASGVDAVLARTAVTVGRNTDNVILDIFASPAVVGIKGVDIRYQLIHQEDVGRFVAHACEHGPAGPVNVAPRDFLPLEQIARILGKPFVEVTEAQALKGVEFAWKHDLIAITPGEIAGISYLPRMAVDRLEHEWGFVCAWSTAEAVYDLRRATTGIAAVATRRIPLPWRLRYPQIHPGELEEAAGVGPAACFPAVSSGDLDRGATLAHPAFVAVTQVADPLDALTLTTYLRVLRTALKGALVAVGADPAEHATQVLVASGTAVAGHRLYVADAVLDRLAATGRARRGALSAGYSRQVARLSDWAATTLASTADPSARPDAALEAAMGSVRDELAWLWTARLVGGVLDGDREWWVDDLIATLPSGVPLGVAAPAAALSTSAGRPACAQAEVVAVRLGRALAALVRERARRLQATGVLDHVDDAVHLTWDELLEPPGHARRTVAERRAEHERLREDRPPSRITALGAASALAAA